MRRGAGIQAVFRSVCLLANTMKLRDLYPYWSDAHEELIELLELITEPQWRARPGYEGGRSVRQAVLGLINSERRWIGEIAQGRSPQEVESRDFPLGGDLIDEYQAARAATERFLADLHPETMRGVRTAPADPVLNELERNVSLAWIVWHVMEQEIFTWGQIALQIQQLQDA